MKVKKDNNKRFKRWTAMAMIAVQTGLYTPYVYAGGQPVIPGYYGKDMSSLVPPSVNALPVVREVIRNATLSQATENELVVHQTKDKAVIDWESFDIGANAHTRFDQQGKAAWSVLNRIHDSNPSQIYGRLTADGNVYLINSNGFLFSQGSSINVHGLVASALNISVPDFDAGLNMFSTHDNTQDSDDDWYKSLDSMADTNPDALIVNHGLIETHQAGSVVLFAPHVVNTGTIDSPMGRIFLGAGTAANIYQIVSESTLKDTVDITSDSNNVVLNESSGRLISDLGTIGLNGSCVNQQGLVQSISAIKKEGRIILKATDSIITGKDSQTMCPISDSDEKAHSSFTMQQGTIELTSGGTIEHQGLILNPSGLVSLTADERIYLGENSRIDVGGVTANLSAQDSVVKVTLNSVELKDDQGQKDGILKGEDVYFPIYEGSSVGDVSSSLNNRDMTAAERAVKGGNIYLTSTKGDIIAREGSVLDFAGGGTHYASGFADTTWLVSGNKVYSISGAPEWISYNTILGSYEKNYSRFGITETVNGIYFGGATAVKTRLSDFLMGADAGILKMFAKTVVLDGILDGSAMPGLYQIEDGNVTNEFGREFALGLEQPRGGELIVGGVVAAVENNIKNYESDAIVSQIVVATEKETLPEQFTSDSTLAEVADSVSLTSEYSSDTNPLYKTVISDDTLSGSGLSSITLGANTSVTVETGVVISLAPGGNIGGTKIPGGRFEAGARTIAVDGQILAPGGVVSLTSGSNRTKVETIDASANPDYVAPESLGPERIYLGENAVISTAGETVNNSLALEKGETVKAGIEDGGTISLLDKTIENGEGVILRKGSVLDVSGGYEIAMDGRVSGGKAGKITLQGTNLVLDGNLLAWSLPGYSGGTIELFAETVNVVKDTRSTLDEGFGVDDNLGEDWATGLILGDNTLDGSGLAHLKLKSILDLTVEEGVNLGPSTVKLKNSLAAETADGGRQLISMSVDEIGKTSVSLTAGQHMDNQEPNDKIRENTSVIVKENSRISTAPDGSIVVNGPGIDMGGTLESPGGSISLKAETKNMVLGQNSSLLARGYNKPDTGKTDGSGSVVLEPMDGGTITLSSKGQLTTRQGSLIDVSGADVVTQENQGTDGKARSQIIAGNAGSVSMTFGGSTDAEGASTLNGTLKAAHAAVDGVTGGELSLMKTGPTSGQDISSAMIASYLDSGFDSLGFGSFHSLKFTDSMTFDIGRALTLDAPEIRASGDAGQLVSLTANEIFLKNNSYLDNNTPRQVLSESSGLSFHGRFLDIQGAIDISGFSEANFSIQNGIQVSDVYYGGYFAGGNSSNAGYYGMLNISGDLFLTSSRIFPTTYSDFIFHSDGKITTRGSEVQDETPVYSAGGRLVLEAEVIDHGGVLAAPLGEVVICGKDNSTDKVTNYDPAESVTLQEGSRITTSGDAAVLYGAYNSDGSVWTVNERKGSNSKDIKFETLPEKKVTIAGDTVVSEQGSTIDVSGGGSVFTYLFQKGVEGTVDPLKKNGSYVLLPVSKDGAPGEGIYITGGQGIAEGRYTIMGEEFAFQPGAVIVTDMGTTTNLAGNQLSKAGYPVVIGYESKTGQAGHSPIAHAYSLRNAKDVLTEGNYSYKEKTADAGGSLSITANTNTLAATLKGGGKGDAPGGIIHLTGDEVIIGITDDPTGKLVVAPSSISGSGFSDISIGDSNTNTLTVTSGSTISVNNLDLAAEKVTVETGVIMDTGYDKTGAIRITAENGSLDLKAGSVIQAGEELVLEAADMTLNGSIGVDKGSLTLRSDSIALTNGSDTDSPASTGLTIDDEFWAMICGSEALALVSNGAMTLDSGLSIEKEGSLVLDTAVLSIMSDGQTDKTADITADTLVLKNNGDKNTVAGLPSADPESSLTLTARKNLTVEFADRAEKKEIGVSRSIALTGMGETTLAAGQELRMKGQGTLDVIDGNLTLRAQAVTAALSITEKDDGTTRYTTADTLVRVGNGTLRIADGGVFSGKTLSLGGDLGFSARSMDVEGSVILPSGVVSLNATGDENQGIFLKQGSLIDVSGTDVSPAGSIVLSTGHGRIVSDQGSVLDVSAGAEGTAGSLSLTASEQTVELGGTLMAEGADSRLTLDVHGLSDQAFSKVLINMKEGGFDDTVSVRARNGNLNVEDNVTVHDFSLTADQGDIRVAGDTMIDGSGTTGGSIALNAGNNLVLEGGSQILAKGEAGNGGNVSVTAVNGSVQFKKAAKEALIDVSASGIMADGKVTFNAGRKDGNSVKAELEGTIKGAASVTVTAVDVKKGVATVDAGVMAGVKKETEDFMAAASLNNTASTLLAGLKLYDRDGGEPLKDTAKTSLFHFAPGIDIQNNGNMKLTTDVDMNGYTMEPGPGTLTFRASGDLTVEKSLLSHPTALNELFTSTARDSWNFNLTAGADLASADVLGLKVGGDTGTLTLSDGAMVYSESGDIRLASRLDTLLGSGKEQVYSVEKGGNYCSVASYDGDIKINTGRDLTLNGSAVQNGTGDIDVETAGDILFNTRKSGGISYTGSIRTTGEAPASNKGYNNNSISRFSLGFLYHDGGDISVRSGGDISGCPLKKEWNVTSVLTNSDGKSEVHWAAGYGESILRANRPPVWTEGIAAMGGGDVSIGSAGNVSCFAGVFGEGDLRVQAGGDLNGRFLVNKGTGKLFSAGSFGTDTNMKDQTLELCDATVSLFAQGEITLGAVVSPSLMNVTEDYMLPGKKTWNPGYTENSSASLKSGHGDISLSGNSGFFDFESRTLTPPIENSSHDRSGILPPSLSLDSGKNIYLLKRMILFPSHTGQLSMKAAGSIDGLNDGARSVITMADYNLALACASYPDLGELGGEIINTDTTLAYFGTYSKPSNHLNDDQSVVIEAGQDIRNLGLELPKKAEIIAGNDIVDIRLFSQNLTDDDVTLVKAGRDLVFSTDITPAKSDVDPGIIMNGPGHLVVMAGNRIDLGSSIGITSVGNLWNKALPNQGCDIHVVSGFSGAFDAEPIADTTYFLDMVRALGVAYTTALGDEDHNFSVDEIMKEVKKALGHADEDFLNNVKLALGEEDIGGGYSTGNLINASRAYLKKTLPGYVDPKTREELKEKLKKELGDKYVKETIGNIDMVRSQIATRSGGDISIISAGELNVGQSVLSGDTNSEGTGINTMSIGDIGIFAIGDVNVNEARLMSWLGGDISVWSDAGNINAGRGSRTEVNSGLSQVKEGADGKLYVERTPAAVGSGIRALTFDPDGVEGPQKKPEPGDVYLFAPYGYIDAGQAGIAGSNIFLGTRTVLNVQNISFSQGAVGAPLAAENTVNLGALTGAGGLSAAGQMGDAASALAAVNKAFADSAKKMEETFLPSWLRVEFMGFDVNDEGM